MLQRRGDAVQFAARRRSVMTMYVRAGNSFETRQFETALTVTPIISATAALPPSLSITSFVDANFIMDRPLPHNFWDCKPQNSLVPNYFEFSLAIT